MMGLLSTDDLNRHDVSDSVNDTEDLLHQIKLLNDKLQKSNEAIKREESEKQYEHLIMSKTHETQLEIKNTLIKNLEDIIDEQEARLYHLQNHVNGIGPLSPRVSKQLGGVTRLRDELEALANRNVELQEKLLREQNLSQKLSNDLNALRNENQQHVNGNEQCQGTVECKSTLRQLENERAALEKEMGILRRKLEDVEAENQRLKIDYERLDIKLNEHSLSAVRRAHEYQSELAIEKENQVGVIASLKQDIKLAKERKNEYQGELQELKIKLSQMADNLVAVQNENRRLQIAIDEFGIMSAKQEDATQYWKSKVDVLGNELSEKVAEMNKMKVKYENEIDRAKHLVSHVRRESTNWQQRHADAIIALDCFRASLRALRQEQVSITRATIALPLQCQALLSDVSKKICENVTNWMSELTTRYEREIRLRKQYHNQLIELKGNIRVFARVRPIITSDGDQSSVMELDDKDDTLLSVYNNGRKQTFYLDKVFGPQHKQIDVFSEVRPLITSVLDGYNVCIFAYGQTGSGKTYTMEGQPADPGINQRALTDLFGEISSNRLDWNYDITVSMLEIYNETIHDLLCNTPDVERLDIKLNSDGYLHVPGLTSITVKSLAEVNQVFDLGRENRATASTNLNEHSSRSHALLCVNVIGIHPATGVKSQGRLNLVDLAGSERVSKSAACGDRLKEAQCINKSLSALGDVIWALKNQHQHVPFRNSKLTYLLQDSLAGNSKTLMIVQVALIANHAAESICSLNFAHRARCVELGQATACRTPTAINNGSNNHEDTPNNASPFVRVPSKNYKSRNGFKR